MLLAVQGPVDRCAWNSVAGAGRSVQNKRGKVWG